jgi:hypothetical protein
MASPKLRVLADESATQRRIKLGIRSDRGAPRIALYFHAPSFQTLLVNGSPLPARTPRFREFLAPGWHRAAVRGAPEAEVEITLSGNEPIEAIVVDGSPGVPPEGAAIVAARDQSVAVSANDGDSTTVMRRVHLGAMKPPPRAWSADVLTSGGYSGAGKGSISVDSDGHASCGSRLSAARQQELQAAIANAEPEAWKNGYSLAVESRRTDQFRYVMSLQLTKSDGKIIKRSVSWQDDGFALLPEDLRRLYDVLWSVRTSECSSRSGSAR